MYVCMYAFMSNICMDDMVIYLCMYVCMYVYECMYCTCMSVYVCKYTNL